MPDTIPFLRGIYANTALCSASSGLKYFKENLIYRSQSESYYHTRGKWKLTHFSREDVALFIMVELNAYYHLQFKTHFIASL